MSTTPSLAAAGSGEPLRARIDPGLSWGTWEGWGISLAWWAKMLGDRDDLADLFFTRDTVDVDGQTLPGLGLNIVRYNAGACSWNEIDGRRMAVSSIIVPFRQIEGFWLDGKDADPDSASWNWSVDANQRSMLLKARDRGADRFELFSNAPMWWMTANDNPSGAAEATEDNLRPENYRRFATYLATIARVAKERWGVSFTSIAPFNEPSSRWWFADCKQEGCHFSGGSQAGFLPVLRSELERQGLDRLAIAASDEWSYQDALNTWEQFDEPTRSLIDQVNVHGYQGLEGPRDRLRQAVAVDGGKRLWNTEYGDKFADGLEMIGSLHLDFRLLRPTAWCYWQPLDGGNEGGWGLLGADLIAAKVGQANPKLYSLAQYSRHIRPGMTLIEAGREDTVAAYHSGQERLAVVTFNAGESPLEVAYDLSHFAADGQPVTSWLTEPLGKARYQPQPVRSVADGMFTTTLPPRSIQTFELHGVSLKRSSE
jgi:galactan endo-1,6-beta-galactosidase